MPVMTEASQTDNNLSTNTRNLQDISTSLRGYNGLSSNYITFYENGIDQISLKMDELSNLFAIAYAALAKLEEAAEVKKQIEELKQKIISVEDDISSVEDDISSEESLDEEEQSSSYLRSLYESLSSLNAELSNLNQRVLELTKKYEQLINDAKSIVSGY